MSQASPPRYSEDGKHWWDGGRWLPVGQPQPVRRPATGVVVLVSLVLIALSAAVMVGMAYLTLPLAAGEVPDGQGGRGAAQPGGEAVLRDVRACSVDDFDSNNDRCSTNRAGKTFQTSQIACSATIATPDQAPRVTFTLLYKGNPVQNSDAQVKRHGGTYAAFSGFSIGDMSLPGGQWACRFTIPKQQHDAEFRIDGPTGPLLYASACDTGQVTSPNGVLLCRSDNTVIKGPDSIACTAIVAGALKHQVKLDITFTPAGGQPVTRSFYGTANSELFGASGRIDPSSVNATTSTMPVGSYTCTWSLDGQQIGQRSFQVQ
jgi:hypothetical protein